MMRRRISHSITPRFFCACLALALAGCLEGSEEIRINVDGSAHYSTDVAVAEGLLAAALAEEGIPKEGICRHLLDEDGGMQEILRLDEASLVDYSENGMRYCGITVEAADLGALASYINLAGEAEEGNPDFVVRELDDGVIRLIHSANLSEDDLPDEDNPCRASEDESEEDATMRRALFASMLAESYYKVTLHAPRITKSNGKTNAAKTTATWQWPMWEIFCQGAGFERVMETDIKLTAR